MFANLCIKALRGKEKMEGKESTYVSKYTEVSLVRFVFEF